MILKNTLVVLACIGLAFICLTIDSNWLTFLGLALCTAGLLAPYILALIEIAQKKFLDGILYFLIGLVLTFSTWLLYWYAILWARSF